MKGTQYGYICPGCKKKDGVRIVRDHLVCPRCGTMVKP